MVSRSSTPPEALPHFEKPEDLERYARSYGIDRDTLRAARTSTEARRKMIEDLQRSGLNGQSEVMGRHLLNYQQEFDRKESWLRKIPLIGKPLDWTWQKVKKHPVLTSLIVLALAAGGLGLYYSGLGRRLLEYLPNYSGSVNRIGREAAVPATPGMALPGGGVADVTAATPPPVPIVPEVPPIPASPSPAPLPPGVFTAPPPTVPPIVPPAPPPVIPPRPPMGGAGVEPL